MNLIIISNIYYYNKYLIIINLSLENKSLLNFCDKILNKNFVFTRDNKLYKLIESVVITGEATLNGKILRIVLLKIRQHYMILYPYLTP